MKTLTIVLYLSFSLLIGRLFQLQILRGSENRFLAENNRIKRIIISAQRGLILDRHGEVLVRNEPEYGLKDNENSRIISRQEALSLQAENKEVAIFSKRKYISPIDFSHLLGFLGEVSKDELEKEKLSLKGYALGSLIGRSGVEMQYENLLKGHDGSETLEVDTALRIIRKMNRIPPTTGKTLTLAADKKIQEVAAEAMKGKKGAIIASIPQTGEILIFYSSPAYDPSELSKLIGDEENRPLLNRTISGLYPPGSTFKIVTAIAGLEEGKITPNSLINDPGVIVVNDYKYSNWYFTQYGRTEGQVNLTKALSRSVDTYFYKVGEYLGAENLINWAKKFGLDKKFGIDLPSESEGFIGTPEWKEKLRGEKWFLGNTYHMAIGQGDLILTPLGVNQMTSVIATGGKLCKPRVLRIGAENTPYQAECRDLGIKKENLEAVGKGMLGACSSGGTGWPFFNFKPEVACKTGTAETGDGKTTHAWFTVFAPAYAEASSDAKALADKSAGKSQIVLTVLVERGGEGSSVAAPIAKEILKEYFRE